MRAKNIPVGPLSAVSPETLRSVCRVLAWKLESPTEVPLLQRAPSWADERVALEFAQTVLLAVGAREREG